MRSNPIRRLLEIVERGRETKFGSTGFEAALGVKSLCGRDYINAMANVYRLISVCESVLAELDSGERKRFGPALPTVKSIFESTHSSDNYRFQKITEAELSLLHIAADLYDNQSNLLEVSKEDLASLDMDLAAFAEKVSSSQVDADLARVLIEGIVALRRAILEYPVLGSEGLKQTVAEWLGRLLLEPSVKANAANEEVQTFWTIIGRAGGLIQAMNHAGQVIDRIAIVVSGLLK